MKIILASQSAGRKRILGILGIQYETKPSNIDEKAIRHKEPEKLAELLARAKAEAISDLDSIVIAGDLFVVFDGKVIEKPYNNDDAYRMLMSYSGKIVEVVASVAVYNTKNKKMLSAVSTAMLQFRELSDYEVKDYIKRYPVTTFSGAFDGDGAIRFTETTQGNEHVSVFPMAKLITFLRENDVEC